MNPPKPNRTAGTGTTADSFSDHKQNLILPHHVKTASTELAVARPTTQYRSF